MLFNEMAMSYGATSIDPAVACQVRDMRNLGRFALGISDGIGPPHVAYAMGGPPRLSDNAANDIDTGCVNPGALAMTMVSGARRDTAAALLALLTNRPGAFVGGRQRRIRAGTDANGNGLVSQAYVGHADQGRRPCEHAVNGNRLHDSSVAGRRAQVNLKITQWRRPTTQAAA